MFLKTLEIKGFKSFADPASMDLEPGVTVVVGPNGSGKSNVVDAIGWVLGAQAPSAVRSQKMDDVIFAGSGNRPALGRAEVALTIDNSSGVLPIEFTEVTISRTLFRSGDSEYAINGVPSRLLDIQELLSDSGVGRQQHIIISQGQIDAVLNAKPEDRRLIIEEAAGVLKYRRRREKSERRLASTEANLNRVQDLLREVRRQLKPLERQADAARRHGAVTEELASLKVFKLGRDVDRHRQQLQASLDEQRTLKTDQQRIRKELSGLDAAILEVEAQLSSMGGQEFGDALVRYESLRERSRGLLAVLAERAKGLEGARQRAVDSGVVASLEAEGAQLRAELATVEAESDELAPDRQRLADGEASLAQAREQFERDWGSGLVAATGALAEARAEWNALQRAVERTTAERDRAGNQAEALSEKVARLAAEVERLESLTTGLAASGENESVRLTEISSARHQRQEAADAAEARADEATAELHRWTSRAEALEMALDEARHRAGADRVADLDGVLGTLLDLVEIDDGWEQAFEAAAADVLGAIVVADASSGRAALAALASEDLHGAILALGSDSILSPAPATPGSLAAHVRAVRPEAEPLIRRLLADVEVVDGGWEQALDAAIGDPDSVIVTTSGDRFGPSGWRLGGGGVGATGAALAEAVANAERARADAERARSELATAREALESARTAETEELRNVEQQRLQLGSGRDALAKAVTDLDEARSDAASLADHDGELARRLDTERARLAEIDARMPALEAAEAERDDQERLLAEARAELETHAERVGDIRTELEVRASAIDDRRRFLTGRIEQVDTRLVRNQAERDEAELRRERLEAKAAVITRLADVVTARQTAIDGVLAELREARRRQSERHRAIAADLESQRSARSELERELEGIRERLQRAEVADADTRLRLESLTETLRAEFECEPTTAIAAEAPELPEGVSLSVRIKELEREIRLMGPINPLALDEFKELQERHEFLGGQLDDIKHTRKELRKMINVVNEEIVSVFTSAFADVADNFTRLFETLFPGGQGRLRLTDPQNLLETGIELEARPSGKNVKKLSLLSGGERSLTALAYLFAVFRSRPSPFYVMDEVEAALDDVNLHRFLGLVAEFRSSAQLLIVSHQKRTMEAADVLYGVTMEPGGSTKVLSERVGSVLD